MEKRTGSSAIQIRILQKKKDQLSLVPNGLEI
jgi:hypothetical protein